MPKLKARKRSGRNKQTQRTVRTSVSSTTLAGRTTADRPSARRTRQGSRTEGIQGMIMPALVSLGCWGMAFSFVVFSTDPNHLLFGGMAALMAIMWSVSFVIRLRKILRRSENSSHIA